ncbi:alanine--tRNA ligase [bacterium]|nr:alanine--tRNA ligase [bacterium]
MKSLEIRQKFFEYFKNHGHEVVPSSSLIPAQDPTLLFANAGMNQFKDVFLGKEKRSYPRATSIQKCMRAGGKHNDLDNVGFTKRHLTFFEMMGNFSFGDYFKKEAIQFAWDFLTKEMGLPVEKLHVSVFTTDDQSYDLWHNMIGLPKEKIHRLGASENFWQMGDTGPCGPCTEIHLDHGDHLGCGKKTCDPACDCDRFLEIWNLVFMQFDRQPDGTDKPLKQTGVDTGMGLERLCAAVQNCDSVFETDIFTEIIQNIELLSGVNYKKSNSEKKAAFHVLADHIRASSLLISDGCAPSNEGRGYVLRKVIRRAALFTQKLSYKNFFPDLVRIVVQQIGNIYPELKTNEKLIVKVLQSEVEKFSVNLLRGQNILAKFFQLNKASNIITGPQAFKLYDTYGFPLELTILMAQENNFTVDVDNFKKEMETQKKQSGKKELAVEKVQLAKSLVTEFTGYKTLGTTATITAIICDKKVQGQAKAGQTCWIITDKSPFYISSGGQEGDLGWVLFGETKTKVLRLKKFDDARGIQIKLPINIKTNETVTLAVDSKHRADITKNHTATHMLQSALMNLFGKHIKQSGSLVDENHLRFDFTYHENLSPQQIKQVENLVNEKIMENIPLHTEITTHKKATNRGVIAFFGDKYNPDSVRVVEIPGFSAELCGGTHTQRTGDTGCFKIVEVSALSAGHRRIIAVTGPKALELFQQGFNDIKTLGQQFKVQKEEVVPAVEKQAEQLKILQKQIKTLKSQEWKTKLPQWQQEVTTINNIPFLFLPLEDFANDDMRQISKQLMQKKPGLYFLISKTNDKSIFICSLDKQFANRVNLKEFSTLLKEKYNLRGGGNQTSLQGGGPVFDPSLQIFITQWLNKQPA